MLRCVQVQHDEAQVHGRHHAAGPLIPLHSRLHGSHTRRCQLWGKVLEPGSGIENSDPGLTSRIRNTVSGMVPLHPVGFNFCETRECVKQTESKIGTEQVVFTLTALSFHYLTLSCTEPCCGNLFGQALFSTTSRKGGHSVSWKLKYLLRSVLKPTVLDQKISRQFSMLLSRRYV